MPADPHALVTEAADTLRRLRTARDGRRYGTQMWFRLNCLAVLAVRRYDRRAASCECDRCADERARGRAEAAADFQGDVANGK